MTAERVLVVSPHPDDETLGAGGTIGRLAACGVSVTVLTVATHSPPQYSSEHRERTIQEARRAHAVLGVAESIFLDHAALALDAMPLHVLVQQISAVVEECRPKVLFVPFPDRHLDHRMTFDAAMVVARPLGAGMDIETVAAFETLSATHWPGAPLSEPAFAPTWFVDISNHLAEKLDAMRCYVTQMEAAPHPRSLETLEALARFRGSSCGMHAAEAYQLVHTRAFLA